MTKQERQDTWREGWDSYHANPSVRCPYEWPTPEEFYWKLGWVDAAAVNGRDSANVKVRDEAEPGITVVGKHADQLAEEPVGASRLSG